MWTYSLQHSPCTDWSGSSLKSWLPNIHQPCVPVLFLTQMQGQFLWSDHCSAFFPALSILTLSHCSFSEALAGLSLQTWIGEYKSWSRLGWGLLTPCPASSTDFGHFFGLFYKDLITSDIRTKCSRQYINMIKIINMINILMPNLEPDTYIALHTFESKALISSRSSSCERWSLCYSKEYTELNEPSDKARALFLQPFENINKFWHFCFMGNLRSREVKKARRYWSLIHLLL